MYIIYLEIKFNIPNAIFRYGHKKQTYTNICTVAIFLFHIL